MANITTNIIVGIINRHINDLQDEIANDCNIYNNHLDKERHDEAAAYAIEELRDILSDIAYDLDEDY